MPTINVLGQETPPASDKYASLLENFAFRVETRKAVQLGATRGIEAAVPLDANDDDVIELEYSNGLYEWTAAGDLQARYADQAAGRGAGDVVTITAALPGSTTRGAPDLVLKGLALLGIDLPGVVADKGVKPAIDYFEGRLSPGPGLYHLNREGALGDAVTGELKRSGDPYLLLLHGAFSSTAASFQHLFASREWADLWNAYDGRILGFNHRSLSQSPVDNALELIGHLPQEATLHLLSHSRGGLVGELLCLDALTSEDLAYFEKAKRNDEIETLRELSKQLLARKLDVRRFVRIACPARGTLLASQRLDLYLSVMLNLIGLVPALAGSAIYDFAKASILTLIKKRADAAALPGLEAMIPNSPLLCVLNRAGRKSSADLAVVAGDLMAGGSAWNTLKAWVTDAFYWQDNDLAVETKAMYGGIERSSNAVYYLRTAPDMNHLNYFGNDQCRSQIYRWLTHETGEYPEEFHNLAQVREPEGDQERLVSSPSNQEFVPAIAGSTTPEPTLTAYLPAIPLNVSVLHASLEHASYPLAIGHYEGDMIVGAEDVLDSKLDKRLSQLRSMNLYPGKAGAVEVILNPRGHIQGEAKGALVIGLGEVGQITPDIVTRGVTEAALRLALARLGDPSGSPAVAPKDSSESSASTPLSAAFSALLIGTRGGRALSIESAVAATVTGAVLANRALANRNLLDKVCVDKVEFVEIYGDLATRAAHAVAEIARNLRITPTVSEKIESEPHLRQGEGGYAAQASNDYDAAWWQRIQIKETSDPNSDRGGGELQFLLLTDRARAELTLQATQRALVERLVEKTIHEPGADPDLSATLYDLLLPNELKEQRLESTNLLLVVDNKAAQYPWEMLAERQPVGGESREPLAVRNGMVRQLETNRYRVQVQAPHSMNALVIGEPLLDDPAYPRLPGASAEAVAVAKVLKEAGYDVATCFREDALTIIKKLYAKEYRIIHIAGHGVYRPDCPAQSGVVLGKNIYLTAAEVGQLRVVPELVFLNCCYLGAIDATSAPSSGQPAQPAWNKLAASVSEKLIEIGVRAVVAAGWAVNDGAAKKFAVTFYQEMTRDAAQFGDAAHEARRAIYKGGLRTNTWGAYQCYGDPGFLLKVGAGSAPTSEKRYVAPQEFILDLKNLQSRASRITDKGWITRYKKDLRNLESRLSNQLPPKWRNGEMLTELGDTFAELGDFEEAILRYRDALSASGPRERVPIRTVEQLANLEARFAARLSLTDKEGNPRAHTDRWTIDDLLAQSEKRLKLLIALAPTAERYAMLGGYYKRRAITQRDNEVERNAALEEAERNYGNALEQPRVADKSYHTLNRLACRCLRDMEFADEDRKQAIFELAAIEEAINKNREAALSFWERIARPDAALGRALVDLVQGQIEREEQALLNLYRREFELGATARERSSALEQLEFMAVILKAKGRPEAAAVIDRLRENLAG